MGLGANSLELQKTVGYTFSNSELLTEAITHSSYANEHRPVASNERLEFLGDAVLQLMISRYLYKAYPEYSEGDLTKIRQKLVCEETLAEIATTIMLGRYLSVGKGEEQGGARSRTSILADALEALIAAVDLDSKGKATEDFVFSLFAEKLSASLLSEAIDYKTKLQQLVQQDGNETLAYAVVSVSGPEHDKIFEVEAYINSNVVGHGLGKSKRDAEQAAAKEALLLFGVHL